MSFFSISRIAGIQAKKSLLRRVAPFVMLRKKGSSPNRGSILPVSGCFHGQKEQKEKSNTPDQEQGGKSEHGYELVEELEAICDEYKKILDLHFMPSQRIFVAILIIVLQKVEKPLMD